MNLVELANKDLAGKVWYMPTDTIPGLSARAGDHGAIERIREMKQRPQGKPFIILCSSLDQITNMGIEISRSQAAFLNKIWPGPVTVAFDDERAVRIPDDNELGAFIDKVGPVVSTSCNRGGEEPILDSGLAKETFGDKIDYYLDTQATNKTAASTIIKIIR